MMEIEICSDHSGYVRIGDHKIYIEVSDATDNRLYLSYWKEGWDDDRTATITGSSSTR